MSLSLADYFKNYQRPDLFRPDVFRIVMTQGKAKDRSVFHISTRRSAGPVDCLFPGSFSQTEQVCVLSVLEEMVPKDGYITQ